jgi:hypothetical protein
MTGSRSGRDWSTAFTVDRSPEEVHAAVLDVRSWWAGEVEGCTDELGAEFTYRHPPQHRSVQRVVELSADRVVWEVVDSHLTFVSDPTEWTGSRIVFEVAPVVAGTELRFAHLGLVPEVECFGACSTAWRHAIEGGLRSLLATGTGLPDPW